MHAYEMATTLRQRRKHESVRLNYGSLYAVVASLQKRRLIVPVETRRVGNLPERTTYRLTESGRIELQDWITDLIATPVADFTSFEAALSFLPTLPPTTVAALLRERMEQLEEGIARAQGAQRRAQEEQIPRLFWIESEYRSVLRCAELDYVRGLADAIDAGTLDGTEWWESIHRGE
jgi:DNA-binding PadR family transcriptional regulator